jgi:hypothetical protein
MHTASQPPWLYHRLSFIDRNPRVGVLWTFRISGEQPSPYSPVPCLELDMQVFCNLRVRNPMARPKNTSPTGPEEGRRFANLISLANA